MDAHQQDQHWRSHFAPRPRRRPRWQYGKGGGVAYSGAGRCTAALVAVASYRHGMSCRRAGVGVLVGNVQRCRRNPSLNCAFEACEAESPSALWLRDGK